MAFYSLFLLRFYFKSILTLNFNSVFILIFLLWNSVITTHASCVSCPLKIPPKPKPLDQFRIPSIQKIIDTSDVITRLCQNSSR